MTQLSDGQIKSINKALQYIEQHLEEDLTLQTVARASNYSPFHFHRLFKSFSNETLNSYVGRKRVEKAAGILLRKKDISISELSTQFGFTSNSSFTRAFKKFYGLNPTQFRTKSLGTYSKIRQSKSKNGQVITHFDAYVCDEDNSKPQQMDSITVIQKEAMNFACINFMGKQHMEATFQKLLEWAGPKGLLRTSDFKLASMFYESLKITAPEKARMSAGILLDAPIKAEDTITVQHFPANRYIMGQFELELEEFEHAWTSMFMWMNANGYAKNDQPVFQLYHNDFHTHPEKKSIVDLYIPIT